MCTAEGAAYLTTRILTPRIGLLWLLLLACAAPGAGIGIPALVLAATLFIPAFRLWDDLADLDYDREHHPDRLLVRSPDLRAFRLATWTLLVALAGLLWAEAGEARALVFLVLVAALFASYRLTDRRPALRPARLALVLAKYPAFVLLAARDPGELLVIVAAAVAYLPPLLDEVRSSGPAVLLPSAIFSSLVLLAWLALLAR